MGEKTTKDYIEGLQLACRFALPPNSLGYCGRDSAPERFKKCITKGINENIEEELTKFIVFHPYLKTISELTGLPKFSKEVIECYCIGNDLIKEIKPDGYETLLENFLLQGVPEWFVDELKAQKPEKFIPTHLFQVLHVGVGKASGAVPFNLESINSCMTRWGEIADINQKDNEIEVELNSLDLTHLKTRGENVTSKPPTIHKEIELNTKKVRNNSTSNKSKYTRAIKRELVPFNEEITPNLKIGDVVAVHWKQTIKKLSNDEIEKLEIWTNEVIESVKPQE